MADRGDTHYRVSKLNAWFLFSSLAMLVATVWMMIDDWNAPWKAYQRDARRIEIEMTERRLAEFESAGAMERESALQERITVAQAALASQRQRLDEAQENLRQVKADHYVMEGVAKGGKAEFDWIRYNVEEHRKQSGDAAAQAAQLEAALAEMNRSAAEKELADEELEQAQGKVDEIKRDVTVAETELAAQTSDLTRVRTRLDMLDPQAKDVRIANVLRDTPGLDFIGPSLKVDKVVLDNLTFELNFTKKKRIDMCTTCHVSIDKEGWEDEQQPLATHPRLDLFLTAASPHPLKDVGCTICHRGSGEALDFTRADHRPSDEHEAEQWHDEHHWHKEHHWDYPMLSTDYVGAGCVQCHTDSMELIADEAPAVTEGYRLFERYGCYACHKVEWFPTKRRPGPSLKNVLAKLDSEFVASWISDPKAFRPTTWMPQFFHLENYPADESVVASEYGAGPEIMGAAWNETAVAAITAFLEDRAPRRDLGPIPVEGDAERGREVFRVSGCLGCHNLAPFPDQELATKDAAHQQNGTNEHGPNLRGVATKLDREWLYHWVKDPKAYWPETVMPNLRLSDQDAADVTAYVMDDPDGMFHDVPEGWEERAAVVDAAALREQARWFYSKLGRAEVERRLDGEVAEHRWDDSAALKVAVGQQLVMHHGCFSCHEIAGMEGDMPIGTELTNWGSKTVDKLDFGFAYQVELGGRPKLDHEYREGWLERKLHAPRSFDLGKVKNPREKLRMPWFDFTDEEVRSIGTFLVGLVDDEVQHARMQSDADELAMDRGLRAIRQKNCVACHVIEPGRVRFLDEDGHEQEVLAELLPLEGESMPPTMKSMQALEDYLAKYEEDTGEEIEELSFRLLGVAPDVGAPGSNLFVDRSKVVAVSPPWGGNFVRTVVDYYMYGVELYDPDADDPEDAYSYATGDPDGEGRVEDADGVLRAYFEEPWDKLRWTFAPPVLIDEGFKLQPEWFFAFLHDPVPLRQQMRVRMPSFHFDDGEAEAIASYFTAKAAEDYPSQYTRRLRLSLGLEPEVERDGAPAYTHELAWPQRALFGSGVGLTVEELASRTGVTPEAVRAIEHGSLADVTANFARIRAYGDEVGFESSGPPNSSFERIERRSPSYMAARQEQAPGGMHPASLGREVAVRGPNCYQCHWHEGEAPDQRDTPIAWAPDLTHTKERLREDWLSEWLWGPNLVYPGTSMPANFLADPPEYQAVYPDSDNDQQIRAVLDWLYNFDRTPATVGQSVDAR